MCMHTHTHSKKMYSYLNYLDAALFYLLPTFIMMHTAEYLSLYHEIVGVS